ncbi:ATP-binding protein [Ideonella sp. DXS22W]|uniref:histidine kinase n=1 Tax=Pseudaquabacterium inlustre TaxID=2984192 RepID=A0ABU9CQD8_9BURK
MSSSPGAYESLLRFLYRSPVALLQTTLDGQIELITPMAARFLMPLAPAGRLDWLFPLIEPQHPGLAAAVAAFTEPRGVVCDGVLLRIPDGASTHLLSMCMLQMDKARADAGLPDASGEAVPHDLVVDDAPRLLVLLNDITLPVGTVERERRALEEQLHLATAAAGLGSWVIDGPPADPPAADASVAEAPARPPREPLAGLRWNPRTFALHGCADASRVSPAQVLAETTTTADRQALADWIAAQLADTRDDTLEYAVRWPDGQRHWLCVKGQLLREVDGPQRRLLAVVWDVTPAHQHRAAVQAQRVAEEASRAKSEFLSRMSHEFRTPLNAILGFAEVLLMAQEPELSPRQRRQVGHMRDAGRLLLQLVSDLLDLSRIEAGMLPVRPEPVDALPAARRAMQSLELAASAAHLQLVLAPPATGAVWVQADPTRLEQVLLNLLSNAVKYNRPGGQVLLRFEQLPGHWQLSVEDNGLGMSPEQQARLFRPFDRLGRETSGLPGAGIGLVIAQQLVLAMQGSLSVRSQPGQGSSFMVVLPVAELPAQGAEAAPGRTGATWRADVRGVVLSVEDNPHNQALMADIVALRPNVRLLTAASGEQALALARAHPPDLVLLDLGLPDIDGLSLWEQLRQLPAPSVPAAVVVSAHAAPAEITRAHQAGVQAYLTKPVDAARLLGTVDRLLLRGPGANDAAVPNPQALGRAP